MSGIDEAAEPAALVGAYHAAGWTDGLPVVPPSDASIAATLAAAGLQGHEVPGDIPGRTTQIAAGQGGSPAAAAGLQGHEVLGEIPGRNTEVVAEKAAINAVMAGCRPEYMPVVVAAVRSLCDPAFASHPPASSTGGPPRAPA